MKKAIVLNSGGLDSATCIAVAKSKGFELYSLSFDYGQKNRVELRAAEALADANNAVSHHVVDLSSLGRFTHSALTDSAIAIKDYDGAVEIPSTYVAARNIIFLSVALSYAETREIDSLFIGCDKADYLGYPDCRPDFISAFQQMANLGLKRAVEGNPVSIETPLIELSKAEVIALGMQLGVDYSLSISCYRPDEHGAACGSCDACTYRKQGFEKAGVRDITRYKEKIHA